MLNSDFEKCAFCVLFVTFLLLIFFDNYYNKKSIQENMPSYLASPGMTLGTQADDPSVWRNIPNNKPLMMKKLKKDKKQYDFRENYQCRPQERIPEINEMEDQDIKYDNKYSNNNYNDNHYNHYESSDNESTDNESSDNESTDNESSDNDNELIVDNYYNFYKKKPKKHIKKPKKYIKKQFNFEPIREIYNPQPITDRPDLNNCVPCKPCKPCKC